MAWADCTCALSACIINSFTAVRGCMARRLQSIYFISHNQHQPYAAFWLANIRSLVSRNSKSLFLMNKIVLNINRVNVFNVFQRFLLRNKGFLCAIQTLQLFPAKQNLTDCTLAQTDGWSDTTLTRERKSVICSLLGTFLKCLFMERDRGGGGGGRQRVGCGGRWSQSWVYYGEWIPPW